MRITSVGGGPAGLYFAILMKKADPAHEIVVFERNRLDDTFGFGVVFSEATQENLEQADPETFAEMARRSARWDDIDIHFRGTVLQSTGHGFSGLSRQVLLEILAERARGLGVDVRIATEAPPLEKLQEPPMILDEHVYGRGRER